MKKIIFFVLVTFSVNCMKIENDELIISDSRIRRQFANIHLQDNKVIINGIIIEMPSINYLSYEDLVCLYKFRCSLICLNLLGEFLCDKQR